MRNVNIGYAVANALGAPLPAPEGSACYLVRFYPDEEATCMSTLGVYSTFRAGEVALVNLLCGYEMENDYDAQWNADLPEDVELTEEVSLSRMEKWLEGKSPKDIIGLLLGSEDEYEIVQFVVEGEAGIGDVKYSINY